MRVVEDTLTSDGSTIVIDKTTSESGLRTKPINTLLVIVPDSFTTTKFSLTVKFGGQTLMLIGSESRNSAGSPGQLIKPLIK